MKMGVPNFDKLRVGHRASRGYVLAYVVVCIAVILSLLAMLLSMAVSKNKIVGRSIDLISRKTEVMAIGEAFIGRHGVLTAEDLKNPVYQVTIEDIKVESPSDPIKHLTVRQGDKVLLVINIEVSVSSCRVLYYEAYWG